MNRVLDACAMIAFLRGEPGAEVVRGILLDPTARCYAHSINLCEVYYDFARSAGRKTARAALRDLKAAGIRMRRDIGQDFWMRIGDLKATQKVSLADCFAIQLSKRLHGDVVTSDHHEFDALASQSICRVHFIR
jgi:PIN domain nuclease of toxin-antitoxin system